MNLITKSTVPKPCLRWAGGKTWFQKHIKELLPITFNDYYEPFLGGASTYINLRNINKIAGHSYLSDDNEELINAYNVIKHDVVALIDELSMFKNEKDAYYEQRSRTYNSDVQKAAKFLFLNRTSFNGIYRVNRQGVYNVPYGNKSYKKLFDVENLEKLSQLFSTATIIAGDFDLIRLTVKKNDLIFLDPPYTVAHENNGFVAYNENIFSWKDQERLADLCSFLNKIKAYYILTNAAHKSIKQLFKDKGEINEYLRPCVIGGGKAKRELYKEYAITNIEYER